LVFDKLRINYKDNLETVYCIDYTYLMNHVKKKRIIVYKI